MFIIESQSQFIRHYVGNEAVAQAVAEDLRNRKECFKPESVEVVDCVVGQWDPGGMLWVGDKHHTFDLGETQVDVYYQHLKSFIQWVTADKTQKAREYNDIKYHKIHSGYMSCVCVTPSEYETLLHQINDAELIFKGSVSDDERQRRINNAGVLQVTKIKNEDGDEQLAITKPIDPVMN